MEIKSEKTLCKKCLEEKTFSFVRESSFEGVGIAFHKMMRMERANTTQIEWRERDEDGEMDNGERRKKG